MCQFRCYYFQILIWTVQVSNETETNDGYIYHPACKQRCPEKCSIGWKTFEDITAPWKIDYQLNLQCGKEIFLEYKVMTRNINDWYVETIALSSIEF